MTRSTMTTTAMAGSALDMVPGIFTSRCAEVYGETARDRDPAFPASAHGAPRDGRAGCGRRRRQDARRLDPRIVPERADARASCPTTPARGRRRDPRLA